jgi:hypothetical protein
MRRLALASALLALAAGACGGGSESASSPQDALAETARNLGDIQSGTLGLRVSVGSDGEEAGFVLEGPFAFAENADALPLADLEYTQAAGGESETVRFVSTGEKAFVVVGGQAYELPDDQVASLRGTGSGEGSAGGLEELRIDDWFQEPGLSDGGSVGGAETDRVRARLDVVATANDLLELAGTLGGSVGGRLEGEGAEQLRRAVESAAVEVYTGKEDRLLRRLVVEARFRAAPPPELEQAFAGLPSADFRLELTIDEPNSEVTVEEPANAQPFPGV